MARNRTANLVGKILGATVNVTTVNVTTIVLSTGQDVSNQANNAYSQANNAYDQANNAYSQANLAYTQANSAFDAANNSNLKAGGSITGNLTIVGNLAVQGNATTINVSNLSVNDSIILLSTNAVGDSNDIGFVGHFDREATATHAGLIRKATENRFYLFDNYEVEPTNNIIDVVGNNFRVGNLRLGIINADSFVTATGLNISNQANTAYTQANNAYGQANLAYTAANNARVTIFANNGAANATTQIVNFVNSASILVNVANTSGNANISFTATDTVANARVLKAGDTMTGQLNISSGGLLVTGNVGIANTNPQRTLVVGGVIESTTGGFRFPDGTTQTTAVSGGGDASTLNGISAVNLFNNMGASHSTRTSFDASTPSYGFGYRYVQGTGNGPGTGGGQYYSWYIGLGSDYPATGGGSYGAMFAVDRNVATPYMSVRYNEGNSFTSWRKVASGYADSAGAVDFNALTNKASGTGTYTTSGDYRAPIFYDSNNTAQFLDPTSTGVALQTQGTGNFGNGSGDTGVGIYYGAGSGDYGRIRFYQAGTNNQTIHSFPTAWQGGTLSSASSGAINLSGANGVTMGSWNDVSHYFSNAGTGYAKADFRAPIFYDNNNTAFYTDPNSESRQYRVRVGPYAGHVSSGNVTGLELINTSGTGDGDVAAMSFHCGGHWGLHMHLRHDSYFGIGGWSASPWRWYVQTSTGNMTAAGSATATAFFYSSDRKLKKDIESLSLENSLNIIKSLNPVKFTWKDTEKLDTGFIAQEVQEILPEAVEENTKLAEKEGEEDFKYLTLKSSSIIAHLTKVVQHQQEQIEELKQLILNK